MKRPDAHATSAVFLFLPRAIYRRTDDGWAVASNYSEWRRQIADQARTHTLPPPTAVFHYPCIFLRFTRQETIFSLLLKEMTHGMGCKHEMSSVKAILCFNAEIEGVH
jgi:hypothetical protein